MKNVRMHREHISKLMYYQFHRTIKIYGMLAAVLIAVPLASLFLKEYSYFQYGYYNEFLLMPTCAPVFLLVIGIWLLYCIYDLKRLHWKYNVQDRELILPISRMDLLISNILFVLTSLYAFYALQSLIYYAGYQIYDMKSPQTLLHNGFFLSVTRTKAYTGMFLPLDADSYCMQLLNSVCLSLLVVCVGRFGFRRHKGILFLSLVYVVIPWIAYFISAMTYDTTLQIYPASDALRVLSFMDNCIRSYGWVYLLALCALMIGSLVRTCRRRAW